MVAKQMESLLGSGIFNVDGVSKYTVGMGQTEIYFRSNVEVRVASFPGW